MIGSKTLETKGTLNTQGGAFLCDPFALIKHRKSTNQSCYKKQGNLRNALKFSPSKARMLINLRLSLYGSKGPGWRLCRKVSHFFQLCSLNTPT